MADQMFDHRYGDLAQGVVLPDDSLPQLFEDFAGAEGEGGFHGRELLLGNGRPLSSAGCRFIESRCVQSVLPLHLLTSLPE